MHLVFEKKYFYNTEAKDFKYFLESKNSFKNIMIEKHNQSLLVIFGMKCLTNIVITKILCLQKIAS